MKSLLRISRRYIMTAIIVTGVILLINMAVVFYFGVNGISRDSQAYGREIMEQIAEEISEGENGFFMTSEGTALLLNSDFEWAMLLNPDGHVVWGYELPEEFPREYGAAEVAAFSRWYLMDYPVRVWKSGENLLVFGLPKENLTRISEIYEIDQIKRWVDIFLGFPLFNLALILLLAFLFGIRFYYSLKPIADGIEGLAEKKETAIPVKGITAELAVKINEASALLKAQDEKLRQRDNARTDWIAGVSHDIRTPLALITGYADELSNERELLEEDRKKAEIIREQSLLIRQLIADLNLTCKLEYQAQPLKKSSFSPAVLLRECVAEYYNRGLDERYEVSVEILPETENIRLYGDTGLLLRAFRNLIDNSIRHNPEGCHVSVSLENRPGAVFYFFRDTGCGIPETVRSSLETEELREENVRKQEEGASPKIHIMGLRIVKQIIRAHGGEMKFIGRTGGTFDAGLVLPYDS